jgi:hypothetical protein
LTEIYLCLTCSDHEIEDGNGAPGEAAGRGTCVGHEPWWVDLRCLCEHLRRTERPPAKDDDEDNGHRGALVLGLGLVYSAAAELWRGAVRQSPRPPAPTPFDADRWRADRWR